jgi:hypothetical protein
MLHRAKLQKNIHKIADCLEFLGIINNFAGDIEIWGRDV